MNNFTRISRKNRTLNEISTNKSDGLAQLIDNTYMQAFRLNDNEFDFLCENMDDDELCLISYSEDIYLTFKEKKYLLNILEYYIKKYYEMEINN